MKTNCIFQGMILSNIANSLQFKCSCFKVCTLIMKYSICIDTMSHGRFIAHIYVMACKQRCPTAPEHEYCFYLTFCGTSSGLHCLPKYSKTFVKRPLKNRQNKNLNDKYSLMKVESIAECSPQSILQYF